MEAFEKPETRPLTEEERTLLQWLMQHGGEDTSQYESQVKELRVVGGCTCGCPTIHSAVSERDHRTIGASHILADFEGVTPEGVDVGVLLHARQGQLSELEVFSLSEGEGSYGYPTIESLK